MNPLLHTGNQSNLKQIDIVKIYAQKKCLIIDDFPEIRGSLSRSLKTFGVNHIDTAANGEEAIKYCSRRKYDIVMCDYNLGTGKDGQQILEEVRFLRVLLMTSLFVMITGESSREMVLGALECQPDDYITKPYTPASLKVRLDKAIIRHEALIDIKTAISEGDYRSALDECNEMIKAGSRYAGDVLKIKAQLHFLLKQLKDAMNVYESVLSKKPLVWAKLGMGKSLLEMGRYDQAEEIFEQIIEEDDRYIEAHDLLAEVNIKRKDTLAAQQATEHATQISPKSVTRHRKLAKLADINHDDELSLKSHSQAIKWGLNSCHESEQDYFNYARKVSEVTQGDQSSDAKIMVKQANKFLDRARKRYSDRPEVAVQAQMVETQMLISQGEDEKAEKSADKAKEMYNELAAPPLDTSLELARTMHALNDEDGARDLLTTLAAKHSDNPNALSVIDSITGEPISSEGKEVATKLTKEGISSYDTKAYAEAIRVFNEALATYPKHIGLHLNLIQTAIADSDDNGVKDEYNAICRRSIRAIGVLKEDHKQYKRYQYLHKQLERLYPSAIS